MIPLEQHRHELAVAATGPAMVEITGQIAGWLGTIAARDGLLTVFLRHTSASLTIQENADPTVRTDLLAALAQLAPESSAYSHNDEGPDDMPAHIKTMLTSVSLSIPVFNSTMALGKWQGVFLIEHRVRSSPRSVILHYVGSCN